VGAAAKTTKPKATKAKPKGKKGGKDDSAADKVPETTIRKAKVSGATATFKFTSSEKGGEVRMQAGQAEVQALQIAQGL
jgi:hypothetical protein